MSDSIILFDTSGVNRFAGERDIDNLLHGLHAAGKVWVSALSIVEAAATMDPERRHALLRVHKRMVRNERPLELPSELVKRCMRVYSKAEHSLTLTVEGDAAAAWGMITNPSSVDDEARSSFCQHSREKEEEFHQYHSSMRDSYQTLFKNGKARPSSAKELLEAYCESDDFVYGIVAPLYENAVGMELHKREVRRLLRTLPSLAAYLLSWGYANYKRAIALNSYGRNNAGLTDLTFATYLPYVAQFITNDDKQHEALKVISDFIAQKCDIMLYDEWRRRLMM